MANFSPAKGLKFCSDYMANFSPGWNISLGAKYELRAKSLRTESKWRRERISKAGLLARAEIPLQLNGIFKTS